MTLDDPELDILDDAISDVGYWRRWVEALPGWVQLEFGAAQLATPGTNFGLPRPIRSLGLRFIRPFSVVFVDNRSEWEAVPMYRGDLDDLIAARSPLSRGPSPATELTGDWPLLPES